MDATDQAVMEEGPVIDSNGNDANENCVDNVAVLNNVDGNASDSSAGQMAEEKATDTVNAEDSVMGEETKEVAETNVVAETNEVAETNDVVKEAVTDSSEEYVCPEEFNEREEMRKMFVQKLDKETTEEEFKEYFATFGEVTEAAIIKKDDRAFGFVTFKLCDDLEECLLKREHTVKGAQVDVSRAVPKENQNDTSHNKTNKLFIANIGKSNVTSEEIKAYLEKRHPKKYGTIEAVDLVPKKDDSKLGFITCSSNDLADRISIGEYKCSIGDNPRLEIKKAVSKDRSGTRGRGGFRGGRGWGGPQRGRGAPRGGGAWDGYGAGYGYGSYAYGPHGGYYGSQDPYYDYSHYNQGYGQRYAPY